jgi:transposase-like protein
LYWSFSERISPLASWPLNTEISPNQLRNWKKEFLENATRVFSESKQEKELRAKEKAMDEEPKSVNSQLLQKCLDPA